MKDIHYIFTILILFISFGLLASPAKSEAWFGYYYPPVNLGYNSPNNNYYNYNNNRYYNSYDDVYYGGNDNNYHIIPDYGRSYSYGSPTYTQGYNNYNNNYYDNYNGGYGSYYPAYTYSGWSRSYTYCSGFYCGQY